LPPRSAKHAPGLPNPLHATGIPGSLSLTHGRPALKITARCVTSNHVHFVYMVRCADGTLYTGYARDLPKRVAAHNNGRGAKYTLPRLPVSLVYSESCDSRSDALKREYQVKRLSRRQKELLLRSDSGST
jgi:putative endonuclease